MKRKAGEDETDSSSLLLPAESKTDKRLKLDTRVNRRNSRSYSSNRKSVGPEIMDAMGVNMIEDTSNDSVASSGEGSGKHTNLALVLKDRDINVSMNRNQNDSYSNKQCSFNVLDENDKAFLFPEQRSEFSNILMDADASTNFVTYSRQRAYSLQPGHDTFNTMSDEVILLVFKWLPKSTLARSAAVCKRWCRLVKDDTLWKRLDLGLRSIRPDVIPDILSRGCVVLRLARATLSSPVFDEYQSSQSSKLQYLDLSMAAIEVSCLADLINECTQLKKLALENCDLNDSVCDAIGRNSKLEVLHLGMTMGHTSKGIRSLLKGTRLLKELNIAWTDIPEDGIQELVDWLPETVDRLCLAGYRDSLQDVHVETLCARGGSRLIELDVSDAAQLTATSISSIITYCIRLESLSTSRCYGIAPASYLQLARLPTLLCLNIMGLISPPAVNEVRSKLEGVEVNQYPLSSVARPTIGIKRTSIWNLRVRD